LGKTLVWLRDSSANLAQVHRLDPRCARVGWYVQVAEGRVHWPKGCQAVRATRPASADSEVRHMDGSWEREASAVLFLIPKCHWALHMWH
jgi:hypothetical protein